MNRLARAILACLLLLGTLQARAAVVAVDAGHGGRDWGAVKHKIKEKDLVLSVAKRLGEALAQEEGLTPHAVREKDEFLLLPERIERAEAAGARALVSLHANSAGGRAQEGVVLYVYGRHSGIPSRTHLLPGEKPLPPPPRSQILASRRFAAFLDAALREEGIPVAGVSQAAFVVLKSRTLPSVLVEMGNLRNSQEAARLADPDFQARLSRALARGTRSYLEGPLALGPSK